jgi:hypothetical protein
LSDVSETIENAPDFLLEPTFLPRITQHDGRAIEDALAATLFDSGVRLKAAVVDASYAATEPPLLKRLRDEQLPCLMESHTQRFTTGRFLEVDQLAGLPYAPESPITADNFDKAQARELAQGVLRFEQTHRCDHYLSAALPYYDKDFQSWASFNDWLLDETCTANGGPGIDRRPLIAQVAPGRTALLNPQVVVNRLLDYPIAGAYVQPLLFNPVKDSAEKLKLYVEFLQAIASEGIPVIAARVGAFGLVLQALGIAAFDSGLGQAEATNLAQLNRVPTEKEKERRREGEGGGPDKRIYLEQLKTTLKGSHATAILNQRGLRSKFVCVHGCCQYRGFEDLPMRRRKHFLCTRDAEVNAVRACTTPGLRRDFVREQLRDAQETSRLVRRALIELGTEAPRFDHLDRWISLLAQEQMLPAFAH